HLVSITASLSHLSIAFFFPLCHPRRPPLFPYTTLFRSARARLAERLRTPQAEAHQHIVQPAAVFGQLVDDRGRRAGQHPPVDDADRKSTRLNSSHVSISYAVFCLKKKKRNRRHTHLVHH